jgi:hypothetical protein
MQSIRVNKKKMNNVGALTKCLSILHLGLGVVLGVGMIGCRLLINQFSFFPDRSDIIDPRGLPPGVAEIFIDTDDGQRLQCYWLSRPESDRLLIYFHGNAGNIGHRIPELQTLAEMKLNVLGVGYRGYGRSTGSPSEEGIYRDGAAALRHARATLGFDLKRMILCGRSLGTTVAVELARNKPLHGVILVTPMTSGQEMGRRMGFGPFARLAGAAFDNLSKISSLQAPLFIVHGTGDEVVPFEMGQALFDAGPHPKRFRAIPGAGHNDLEITAAALYWGSIRDFVAQLDRPPESGSSVR